MKPNSRDQHRQKMSRYYQFQAKIYDQTRWSFLFGRKRITQIIPLSSAAPINILEVGCGTGANLERLAKQFNNARITGIDVAPEMLKLAATKIKAFGERVDLKEGYYGEVKLDRQPDVILFSYCLTMVNPGWDQLILRAHSDLKPGGYIAVVDFHASKVRAFKNHMGNHHVRMDAHLRPLLEKKFAPVKSEVNKAYGGLWQYLMFVGKKKTSK